VVPLPERNPESITRGKSFTLNPFHSAAKDGTPRARNLLSWCYRGTRGTTHFRLRERSEQLKRVYGHSPENGSSQCQNLALTGLIVPDSGPRDAHSNQFTEDPARAGLYLLIADVTVSSHSGHPTRVCIPRVHGSP